MYIAIFSFLFVLTIYIIIILVTKLKQKQDALDTLTMEVDIAKKEVALLKEGLNKMDLLYLAHDMEGTIVSLNKATEQMLGLNRNDVNRRKITEFLSSEGQLGWENHIKTILQKEDSYGRLELKIGDKEKIVVRYISVINLDEEIPVSIHMVAQPEQVILQNKWMDALPVPCLLVDRDGNVISATHDETKGSLKEISTIRHLDEVLKRESLKKYKVFCSDNARKGVLKFKGITTRGSAKKQKYSFWVRYIGDGLSLVCAFPETMHMPKIPSTRFNEEQLHNLHGYISAILGFTQLLAEDLAEKKVESSFLSDILMASKRALAIFDMDDSNDEATFYQRELLQKEERPLILLVDDDMVLLRMNTIFIEQLGFKVISANSGQQAIDLFKENQDRIAVVVSDIRIPDFSGYYLAQKFNTIRPDIPVVLISGQIEDTNEGSGNIYKILLKPIMPNLLKQVIFDALSKKEQDQVEKIPGQKRN